MSELNLEDMMKKLVGTQEKIKHLQEELGKRKFTGEAGGQGPDGNPMCSIIITAKGEIISLTYNQKVWDLMKAMEQQGQNPLNLVQDFTTKAFANARKKAEDEAENMLNSSSIPDILKVFGDGADGGGKPFLNFALSILT